MGILSRLNRLDRVFNSRLPRQGEYRHEYLARIAHAPPGYVPREVYAELVDLHDKVAVLEAKVAALEARG